LLKVFESTALDTLARPWLSLQCHMITGVERGVVIIGAPGDGNLVQSAYWPNNTASTPGLTNIAKEAIDKQRGVIRDGTKLIGNNGTQSDYLGYPLRIGGHLIGVVAIEVSHRSIAKQKAILELLQWGCAWLGILLRQQTASVNIRLVNILELLIQCLETDSFKNAATALVTEAAVRLDCERVSLGLVKGKCIEVVALSHSANFDNKSVLLQHIGSAMDEAVDQDASIVFPSSVSSQVVSAHELLSRHETEHAICTVPLVHDGEMFGALSFERSIERPFETAAVEMCEQLAMLVGPVLKQKRENDRWIVSKLAISLRTQLKKLFGSNHVWLKTVVTSIFVLAIVLSSISGEHRIVANAILEGGMQRMVVSPIAGFISTASARAGDLVKKDSLLVTLEDNDLILEQVNLNSKLEEYKSEYRSAMAERERARVGILNAQIAQTKAQLRLLNEKLLRTKVRVPIDGVVIQGDLSQSLGAPVEQGQALFTIAPLEDYRIILKVDEREIREIKKGQAGHLALASLPNQRLKFEVTKITPVSITENKINYFRVEAELDEVPKILRPGMEGIGKIDTGEKRWIWIWTHPLVEWLQMKLWYLSP